MKHKSIIIFFACAFFGSNATLAAIDTNKKTGTEKTISGLSARTNALENQLHLLENQIHQMRHQEAKPITPSNKYFSTLAELYAHGPAVVTSPVFGLRATDEGLHPELMVSLSKINRDLLTLKLRKKMDNYAIEHGIPVPQSPLIVLSGGLEGRLAYYNNSDYTKTSRTEVKLNRAELDVVGEVGSWVTASMIIAYDDKPGNNTYDSNVTRVNNSRLQIDRAWLTIGQLNKSPVYFSIGQLYAPFGNYARCGITTTSMQTLGRMKDRMVILGYDRGGFNAQIYGFTGETKTATDEPSMARVTKHGGADLNYKYENEKFGVRAGAGIIGNLAESEGMQEKIFGKSTDVAGAGETLKSRILGYDGYVKFDIYDFDLLAEYVTAAKAFDPADITFNDHGARPQALSVEAAYSFKIKDKLNTVFAGYGLTSQALALGLPKQNFVVGYNIAPLNNILAAIEYRHDINYGWNDTASSTGRSVTTKVSNGRHQNIVTIQIGAYF